jgi:hypothetical protein
MLRDCDGAGFAGQLYQHLPRRQPPPARSKSLIHRLASLQTTSSLARRLGGGRRSSK